jgi:amidase
MPYRFDVNPTGSSSGSGVAGTMGFATLTVGSETSGSIIAPSWRNSLVGVKPTLGLVSRIGIIPLGPSWDTAGPMTRTVTDAAALLQVLAFADAEDPPSERFVAALAGKAPDYLAALSTTALQGARIGVRDIDTTPYGQTLWQVLGGTPSDLFVAALQTLEAEGAELVAINDPLFTVELAANVAELGGIFNEFKLSLNHYLATESGPDTLVETLSDIIAYNEQHPDQVKYGQTLLQLSDAQTGSEMDPLYLAAREASINSAQQWMDNVMAFYDLDAIVSWDIGNANYPVTAAAGYPNVTVPIGYHDRIPHGIEIGGLPFEEARLLAYAYDFEQATQARRAPPRINPELLAGCRK